ncbi:hypothetical protein F4809DRAFT_265543 [Biscogniauxia mediterranea]|nr:hypothetical protein F4809DRAFT_265543 [Biscogniauxia mediterranea]
MNHFWTRALEFYFLEQKSFLPNNTYPCLMLNCSYNDFKGPREMLLHLKQCELFPGGKYLCPACNRISSFRTSGRRCSRNKVSFGSKIRKTLKSPMTLIKDMMRRNSAPNLSAPGLEVNQRGIEEFNSPKASRLESSKSIYELNDDCLRFHPWTTPSKPEWSNNAPVELEGPQPQDSPFNVPELDSSQFFDYNPHNLPTEFSHDLVSQISPSQPSSASSKSHGQCLSDVSPTSGTTTAQSTPTGGSDLGIIDLTTHQGLISNQSIQQEIAHIESEYPDLWPTPSPQPSATVPEYNTELENLKINDPSNVLSVTFISQAGFQNTRVPPLLSIETGNLVPNFHIPVDDRDSFKCDTGACDSISSINAWFQQPPLDMTTQIYNTENFPYSGIAGEKAPSDTRDSDEPDYSPRSKPVDEEEEEEESGSNMSPDTESPTRDAQLKCEHCPFVPSGKEKHLRAYLRKHLKTHEDLIPLPCPCCETPFTRQDNRTHHIRVFHPDFQISPIPSDRKRKRSSASLEIIPPKRKRSSAT